MKAAILADDTTGALEAGAILAGQAIRCQVLLEGFEANVDAVVVTTESRHLPPGEAAARVDTALRSLRDAGVTWFYKKTDSTLRGNIASEFEALLDASPGVPLVYVPAYPAVGRAVRNGVLFVNGRPVAETEFRNDPHNPVSESSVVQVVEGRYPAVSIARPGPAIGGGARLIVCDASTDEDLSAIAAELQSLGRTFLAAGPAGFIRHWAAIAGLESAARRRAPVATSCLFVCGSRHPVSRRMNVPDEMLSTPDEFDPDPAAVAERLAQQVRERLDTHDFDALVVFGGDTTAAVLRSLEIRRLQPIGEVMPGVPVSLAKFRGWPFTLVTKAGGFGGDDTAIRISRWLKGER